MKFQDEVQLTVESGINPIELILEEVKEFSSEKVFAFRTRLEVNSLDVGNLTPAEYRFTAERTKRALYLTDRALVHLKRAFDKLKKSNVIFDWISLYCTDVALTKTDFVSALLAVFPEKEDLSKICLEFSPVVLYNQDKKLMGVLKELKSFGIKLMLHDFGEEYSPMVKLLSYGFDFAIAHKKFLEMMRDEELSKSAQILVSYAKTAGISVLVSDIEKNDFGIYSRIGCRGYIEEPIRALDVDDDAEDGADEI